MATPRDLIGWSKAGLIQLSTDELTQRNSIQSNSQVNGTEETKSIFVTT